MYHVLCIMYSKLGSSYIIPNTCYLIPIKTAFRTTGHRPTEHAQFWLIQAVFCCHAGLPDSPSSGTPDISPIVSQESPPSPAHLPHRYAQRHVPCRSTAYTPQRDCAARTYRAPPSCDTEFSHLVFSSL